MGPEMIAYIVLINGILIIGIITLVFFIPRLRIKLISSPIARVMKSLLSQLTSE